VVPASTLVEPNAADVVDATTASFDVTMTAISVLGATPAAAAVPAAAALAVAPTAAGVVDVVADVAAAAA
jgi:hypothetical protein